MTMLQTPHETRDPQNGPDVDWLDEYTRDPNPNEVDAASKYDDYTVEIVYSAAKLKRYKKTERGILRWSGHVNIYDGLRKFVIRLPKKSHARDLKILNDIVEDIRSGRLLRITWNQRESNRYPGETYVTKTFGFTYKNEKRELSLGEMIIPCTTDGCQDSGKHHAVLFAEDVTHTAEEFEGSYGNVYIHKYASDDGNGTDWLIDHCLHDSLTAQDAADLANDLAYASTTLVKLGVPA